MTTTNGKLRPTDGVWPAGFDAVERIVFDLGYRAGWDARSWRREIPWPVQHAVVRMLDRAAARLARAAESWDAVTIGPADQRRTLPR
jgi:hypothetical protein